MKIILAQGNPGIKYSTSRHNVGFRVVEAYAKKHGLIFKPRNKFQADIAEFNHDGDKLLLVKPTTFYNETGSSARALLDFYKLEPSDFLIIHDELALPFGLIRTRQGGSDAGNNGIKSINRSLGPDTTRIRVGIWNGQRDQTDDANFVLSQFTADEASQLTKLVSTTCRLIDDFVRGQLTLTTHK